VADRLGGRADVAFLDLQRAVQAPLQIDPGNFISSDGVVVAEPGTTVWWRRTGFVPSDPRAGNAENRLRAEEVRAQVVGGLLALGVRWVDHPETIEIAEHTLLQLTVARSVGAAIPATVVTNDRQVAAGLTDSPLVAKSISSGIGIAPYADFADEEILAALPNAPTTLQAYVPGTSDLRVVVVGDHAFVWRRAKHAGEPFDWRMPDPSGREFVQIDAPELAHLAVAITRELNLSFSAQDWVETGAGPVFLEANPVGQWLFLAGADRVVGNALANLLLEES
jgi:glutathione synthase/RimK-type ligase-like ATP-grasp enzyme